MNRFRNYLLVSLALLSLTSCAFLPGGSTAFEIGERIGEKYALAKEGCELFGEEMENQDQTAPAPDCNLDPAEIEKYCTGIWLATAFIEALENNPRNREDFIAGCRQGSGT
jgi:hypothetical protein